ncbi:PSD1 and planctomycete cytochrome C domain-containing protein [soil metagenome]
MSPLPHLLIVLALAGSAGAAHAVVSYNRDVRPILSDKCFACHGPDSAARKAKLRLDIREDALAAEAFVPGDAEASELVYRLFTDDPDEVMPPPEGHKTLAPEERETLRQWVAEGAEYQPHWAYIPPARPAVPDLGHPNPVDNFVAANVAGSDSGLALSPPATPATLVRRLHLDLTGLPPTPEQVASFAALPPDGWDGAVAGLMGSPAFGERMAVFWLDLARYADTVGYHGDQERDISPYRDYVIDAFNSNMPFDQFVTEQIAGDLLENPTQSQRVATTFNRANQISSEGGIQDAEYIAKYYAERVRTTSTAFLGSTLACAECHDHKFDPFTTEDFYSMEAFFADILEKGAYNGDGHYNDGADFSQYPGIEDSPWGPMMRVLAPEQLDELAGLDEAIAATNAALAETTPDLQEGFRDWLSQTRAKLADTTTTDLAILDDEEYPLPGGIEIVSEPVASGAIARRQSSDGLTQHIVETKSPAVTVAAGDRLFAHVLLDPNSPPKQLMLQFNVGGEWGHRAWWGEDHIPYGQGSEGPDHFFAGPLPEAGSWVRLEVAAAEVGIPEGAQLEQLAFTQFGGTVIWDFSGRSTSAREAALASIPDPLREPLLAGTAGATLTDAQSAALLGHYRGIAPETAPKRERLADLDRRAQEIRGGTRSTLVTVSATPREIRVLPRGDWTDRSGKVVEPQPPAFLPGGAVPADGRASRLDLARWIVSPENPLTARTFVNRAWKQFFGAGISRNLNDLGNQGNWPTHPDLLDWLAVEFVESGWDVKHLITLMVTSETYRQTADVPASRRLADPSNKLLARQVPRRLAAEFVRDNALAASGLLVRTVGGPSARPYQPPGYYASLNFPRREYQADTGDNQYRRGLYTHWQRTFLHPMLVAFDAPSREECTAERTVSNTPLQALDLLNDPTFVEAARALAARAMEAAPEAEPRLHHLFQSVLGRSPSPDELALLSALLAEQLTRYTHAPDDAAKLVSVGLAPVPKGIPAPELAAYTAAARAVLNLHESITVY